LAIAREAAPALVWACQVILEQYVRDECEAASYPLPRARTEQVVSAARRLQALELVPEVCEHLFRTVSTTRQGLGDASTAIKPLAPLTCPSNLQMGRTKTRGHLLLLFSPMCRCISSNNPMLRDSLRAMLELVGHEVGLAADASLPMAGAVH